MSSSSSLSVTSSTSNKYSNGHNQSQQRDDSVKPSKSSSSVTPNGNTAQPVFATHNSSNKPYLTNSTSLHGNVSTAINDHDLSSSHTNNIKGLLF